MKKLFTYFTALSMSTLTTFAVVSCACVYPKTDKLIKEECQKKSKEDLLETNKKDKLIKEQAENNKTLESENAALKSKLQIKIEEIIQLNIELAQAKTELDERKPSILDVDAAELAANVANLTTKLEICHQEKDKLIKEQAEK